MSVQKKNIILKNIGLSNWLLTKVIDGMQQIKLDDFIVRVVS